MDKAPTHLLGTLAWVPLSNWPIVISEGVSSTYEESLAFLTSVEAYKRLLSPLLKHFSFEAFRIASLALAYRLRHGKNEGVHEAGGSVWAGG